MANFNKIYLYRMVHIANMGHIIQYGITHKDSLASNPSYLPIGDNSLIDVRSGKRLPDGTRLGDYIPFYFHYRMPMLYVLQKGFNQLPACPADQIVYCISSVQKVLDLGLDFIFTNGHAAAGLSSFYDKKDVERITTLLDFEAITASYWKSEHDLDLKRRKEAEFLILGDVPSEAILGFAAFNESAQKQIANFSPQQPIIIRPNYYF